MTTLMSSLEEQTASIPRARLRLKAAHLLHNFKTISERVPHQKIIPMIKANAYGHGMHWVAQTLKNEKNIHAFGVATFDEGIELRKTLGSIPKIIVFASPSPWTREKRDLCIQQGLIPVIASNEDFSLFIRNKDYLSLPYEIKFNTGMNRLGLDFDSLEKIREELISIPRQYHPQGIMTHLANSETPSHPLSKQQIVRWKTILSTLSAFNQTRFHFGNSGAIWNHKAWKIEELGQCVRPGVSLYGIAPTPKIKTHPFKPVMKLEAQVALVRQLQRGDSVGYGSRYKVPAGKHPWMAVVSMGYADGLHRRLSSVGLAMIAGKKEKILGTISMDLTAVSCSEKTKPGDWAEIFGDRIPTWTQAELCGTIPYELMTSISSRVSRIYE